MAEPLSWHRAGQNVVALGSAAAPCGTRVEKDRVYTIREVVWPHASGLVGLRLASVYPQPCEAEVPDDHLYEPAWLASGFRPVRDTSIESLRGLLSPTPETEHPIEEMEHA